MSCPWTSKKKKKYQVPPVRLKPGTPTCRVLQLTTEPCNTQNTVKKEDRSPARPIFFQRIDDSHCIRIHSSLTTVCCFDNCYMGKQLVAWREYCAEYWLKELQESMDWCTGHRNITEILLKMVLNTI